jgi:hypothetical protein
MTVNNPSILSALKTHLTQYRGDAKVLETALQFQKNQTQKAVEAIGDAAMGQNVDIRV